MTTHPTPDALSTQAENELLCEKLLGWKRRECRSPYDNRFMGYDFLDGDRPTTAPTFLTGDGMLMLMEAMANRGEVVRVDVVDGSADCIVLGRSITEIYRHAPAAVRAAALKYARKLP